MDGRDLDTVGRMNKFCRGKAKSALFLEGGEVNGGDG